MYAQVCTRPDIAFMVGILGRYQSNPGNDHWVAATKLMILTENQGVYACV